MDPSLLTTISSPSWWPFPIDLLVGSTMIQGWLHRYTGAQFFANACLVDGMA